jgi:hypothetical protein
MSDYTARAGRVPRLVGTDRLAVVYVGSSIRRAMRRYVMLVVVSVLALPASAAER